MDASSSPRPHPSSADRTSAPPGCSWRRVLEPGQLPDGRATTVTIDHRSYAATHVDGLYGLLDDRCPHRGGPLGQGSIERGWLRCPRRGYDDAAQRLAEARRPRFVLGAGARDGIDEILSLAEALGAPVVTTFKAKGLLSDAHELAGGVLGRSGTPIASRFMNECDLSVGWGASFSNHTGTAPSKPIVQVDRDPLALGRFHPVAVRVVGDVGVTAAALAGAVDGRAVRRDHRAELADRWSIWRTETRRRAGDDRGRGVGSAAVFAALGAAFAHDGPALVHVRIDPALTSRTEAGAGSTGSPKVTTAP